MRKKRELYLYRMLAFFVPVLITAVIFYFNDIIPFGENWDFAGDFYAQIYPFFAELSEKMQAGGSPFYTWNLGLGSDFFAIGAYYLICPFNLIFRFVKSGDILDAVSVISIIKFGLAGLGMYYYLERHFCRKWQKANLGGIFAVIFGALYALSPFMLFIFTFTMWTNTLILFPLLLLSIERLVKQGKGLPYSLTLAAMIASNYYMAIVVCIFSAVYFIVVCLMKYGKRVWGEGKKTVLIFVGSSLLAGCACAVWILPECHAILGAHAGGAAYDFSRPQIRYTPLHILYSAMNSEAYPLIFSTVSAVILVPLYFMNPDISGKKKKEKGIYITALTVTVLSDFMIYLCNGLHIPNGLPVRWAYMFVFFILLICYEEVILLPPLQKKKMGYLVLAATFVYTLFAQHWSSVWFQLTSGKYICVVLAFLAVGILIYFMGKGEGVRKRCATCFFALFLLMECGVTGNEHIRMNFGIGSESHTREEERQRHRDIENLLGEIADREEFVRVKNAGAYTANEGALFGYHSLSSYTSMQKKDVGEVYRRLGLGNAKNLYSMEGSTPVTDGLLGVKYILCREKPENGELYQKIAESGDFSLYESLYPGGVFWGIAENGDGRDLCDLYKGTGKNPLEEQNRILERLTGVAGVFVRLEEPEGEKAVIFPAGETVYMTDYENTESLTENGKALDRWKEDTFSLEIYHSREGYTLEWKAQREERKIGYTATGETVPAFYVLDKEKYKSALAKLGGMAMKIEEYGDTVISGSLVMAEDGFFLTTVPYDEGWRIYIDGKEAECESASGAFLCAGLKKGTHRITLKYSTKGLAAGTVISGLCILIYTGWFAAGKRKRKDEGRRRER